MIEIKNEKDLQKYKKQIEKLFKDFGKTHEHCYNSLLQRLKSGQVITIFLSKDFSVLFSFKQKNEYIWQSDLESFPCLFDNANITARQLLTYIEKIKDRLGAESLYFPLVYETSIIYEIIKNYRGTIIDRLPTSIIYPEQKKCCHIEWFKEKNRYKFRKRKRLFEDNLEVKELNIESARKNILNIENMSWKHDYGMDMESRHQLDYYSNMIEGGDLKIVYAVDKRTKEPVAYRLDSIVNGTVYQIKTSFNKNYSKLTPGVYLNTINLFETYDKIKYNYIDLYGSPNIMKDEIEEARINRYDLYFPNLSHSCSFVVEDRMKYDSNFMKAYQNRQGIKNMWRDKNEV